MKPAAIGVDLVDVASFGEQLGQEGSVFHRVFTAREWNAAARFTPEQGGPASEASEALSTSHASSGLSMRSMSMRSIQSLAARWSAPFWAHVAGPSHWRLIWYLALQECRGSRPQVAVLLHLQSRLLVSSLVSFRPHG